MSIEDREAASRVCYALTQIEQAVGLPRYSPPDDVVAAVRALVGQRNELAKANADVGSMNVELACEIAVLKAERARLRSNLAIAAIDRDGARKDLAALRTELDKGDRCCLICGAVLRGGR